MVSMLVEMNYSPAGTCLSVSVFHVMPYATFSSAQALGSEIKREKLDELSNTNTNLV